MINKKSSEEVISIVADYENPTSKEMKIANNIHSSILEDPAIIMRVIRMYSETGIAINKETKLEIFKNKDKLKLVSCEDIHENLKGIILGEFALKVMNEYRDIISVIIPEIEVMFNYEELTPGNILYLWTHSLIVMNNANSEKYPFEFKLAGLLHDIGKPNTFQMNKLKQQADYPGHEEESAKIAEEILRRLEFPKKEIAKIAELIRNHGLEISEDPYEIEKSISKIGLERFMDIIDFQIANKYEKNTYEILGDKRVDKLKKIKDVCNSLKKSRNP